LVDKARLQKYWGFYLLVAGVFPLCIAILVQSPLAIFVSGSWFIILCYMAYLRLAKRRKPKYPLVPPEGKPNGYIPRPIHEDFDEMKRKREKLKKMKKRKKH